MDGPDVAELARSVGLADCAEEVGALAEPCMRLAHASVSPGSGGSKLGGLPDLPADTPWPTSKRDGTPAAFIAQIDLASVDPTIWPGPKGGVLSFFCSIAVEYMGVDDGGLASVLHIPPGTPLEPRPRPEDLPDELHINEVPVSLAREITVPTIAVEAAAALKPLGFDPYDGAGDEEREELYMTLQDRLGEVQHGASDIPGRNHQLLGWPRHVQGDVLYEFVLYHYDSVGRGTEPIDYENEIPGWRLLLQVDTDRALGIDWADGGTLFFGIPADDLADGRFDRVEAALQSC